MILNFKMKRLRRWESSKDLSIRKKKFKNFAKTGKPEFGFFTIFSRSHGVLTYRQVNSIHMGLRRRLKPRGRVWLKVLPNHTTTKKGSKTRMGKGKGRKDRNILIVNPGAILFEFKVCMVSDRTDRLKSVILEIKKKFPIKVEIFSFTF